MLKKSLATTKKDQFWIGHVKKAQAFKGSNLEYCKLNNLKTSTFGGYKKKFGVVKKLKPSTPCH